MPLQWNLNEIFNYKEICWIENLDEDRTEDQKYMLHPTTEALIQLCGLAGISRITSGNYKEVTQRLAELEILGITYEVPTNPREAEVKAHIGLTLTTDIIDNKKWGNKLRNILRQQAQGLIDNSKTRV